MKRRVNSYVVNTPRRGSITDPSGTALLRNSLGFLSGAFAHLGGVLALVAMASVLLQPAMAAAVGYVANFGGDTVSMFDTATNTVVGSPIPVGSGPSVLASTADGKKVYVTSQFSGTVSVINTTTNMVTATIPVGIEPLGLAITPDGSRIYVANSISGTISVINASTNTVAATIAEGGAPAFIAITADGTRGYVTDLLTNAVVVINLTTNTMVTRIPVGTAPFGIAITPDGAHLYVANFNSSDVSVISTATNTVQTTIGIANNPGYTFMVAVTPDGTRAYVTTSIGTQVINTATNTLTAPIMAGGSSIGVAFTRDGTRSYISNPDESSISVIDTSSSDVIGTIPVGNFPQGVLIPTYVTTFASFSPKLNLTLATGVFNLNSTLTLGAASNGINPLIEPVTLVVGSYSVTFPAGSFQQNPIGFVYAGVINGVTLAVQIAPLGGNQYSFKVSSMGAPLTGVANPVPVTLTIGDDTGTASVTAAIQ